MATAQSQTGQPATGYALRPWLRRIEVDLGPLEEWRGMKKGEIVRFASDGTPKGLKITGSFQKTVMGMPSPSTVSVYNLARDTRDAIRGSLTKITVRAGWQNTELHTLFQGSVLSAVSERQGADIVTKISAIPGYGAMVRGITSKTWAAGTPVKDVVADLARDMPGLTVSGGGMEGVVGTIGEGGWSFAGSSKDGLTQLANEQGFSWSADDGEFKAVGDKAVFGGYVELNGKDGGLLSVTPTLTGPMQIQTGVKIKALYVPGITAGASVKVNSDVSPKLNGTYRVNTCNIGIDTHSDQWTMDIDAFTPLPGTGKASVASATSAQVSAPSKKAAKTPENPTGQWEQDFDAFVESLDPLLLTEKDRLLLCLPEIAEAMSKGKLNEHNRRGWLHLQSMLRHWFSGQAEAAEPKVKNPDAEPFWVDWNWVMSFQRARDKYAIFTRTNYDPYGADQLEPHVMNEAAQKSLGAVLCRDGYMGVGRVDFDFTELPCQQWQQAYHTHIAVPRSVIPDGLQVAMGAFTLRALAGGWTEPNGKGGHAVHVTKMAVFVHDVFNFEEEWTESTIGLMYWSCEHLAFNEGYEEGYTKLNNGDFRNFRDQYGQGGDFLVLSQPHKVANLSGTRYDFTCP